MSIVIAILKQPVCCISTDSCQTKIYDFSNPALNEYYNDVNKIHLFGKFVIAECGNPRAFSEYWQAAERSHIAARGIEYFTMRSREIISAASERWRRHYSAKWPSMPPEKVRSFSRAIAIIAGYSLREGRIIVSAVSDDESLCATLPENGFIVSGGSSEAQRGAHDYLNKLLTGRRNMAQTTQKMLQASIMTARHASRLEYRHTAMKSIAGRVRQMVIEGDSPPVVVVDPVVNI